MDLRISLLPGIIFIAEGRGEVVEFIVESQN
jgi:hypothetical protein